MNLREFAPRGDGGIVRNAEGALLLATGQG